MKLTDRQFVALGAVVMFFSVAAGAFGAHGIKPMLSAELFAVYETAVRYQAYHGLAVLIVGVLLIMPGSANFKLVAAAGYSFLLGILLFSGSLYLYVFTGIKALGMITPVGGLLFLVGWLLLALSMKTSKEYVP